MPVSKKPTPKGRVDTATAEDEDCCGWQRVAGPPSDGELSGGDWRPQPR